MRLDKFLKDFRIVKRRSVARDMIRGGRIRVNGRAVKPSRELKEGDIVEVFFGNRYLKFRVLTGGYETLEDERVRRGDSL